MTTNSGSANDQFRRLFGVTIAIAGLVWLGLALYNARNGAGFNWGGAVPFLVIIAGLVIARSRGAR